MKRIMKSWLLVLVLIIFGLNTLFAQGSQTQKNVNQLPVGEVVKIPGNGQDKFYWDYYIYIPHSLSGSPKLQKNYILVFPNNTGKVDDDIRVHDESVKQWLPSSIRVSEALKVVLLSPVFPRPKTGKQWKIYTHALDRDVMLTKDKRLGRLDLQLISMIDDARQKLEKQNGLKIEEKVLMYGFSASAMFVNRFCLLHPTRVQAASIGSPGGWAMLPVGSWNGEKLRYPIGIGDFKRVTGSDFDVQAFRQLKLYFFVGDQDTNDSVKFRDGYEKKDEKLIFRNFGSSLVSRLHVAEKVYREQGCSGCQFVVYKKMGHETTREVAMDLLIFFTKAMEP